MPDGAEENSRLLNDLERRHLIWRTLIEEGVLQDKPPEELSEADRDAIEVRIALEDHASRDGQSVDQMLDGWEEELRTAHGPFTVEQMMKWLCSPDDDPGYKPDDALSGEAD